MFSAIDFIVDILDISSFESFDGSRDDFVCVISTTVINYNDFKAVKVSYSSFEVQL